MKKLTLLLIAVLTALTLSFAFTGCKPSQPAAQDVFETENFVFTLNKTAGSDVYTVKPTEKGKSQEKLTIPGDIYGYRVTAVGQQAFKDATALKELTLSSGITIIEGAAFSGCKSLTSLTLPDTLVSIKANAFENCDSLQRVDIPSSVRAMEAYAFSNCKSLSSVTLSASMKTVADYAFSETAIRSITIPDGVKKICAYAFAGCEKLSEVKLPASLSEIATYAFSNCTSLTEILFPRNDMLKLGAYAFCFAGLTKVYIPENVILGEYTFMKLAWDDSVPNPGEPSSPGLSGCTAIYYESPEGSLGTNAFGYTWNRPDKGFHIYVPSGSMNYYTSKGITDEAWNRCVVNSVNSNNGEFKVLQEYDISEVFPDGFPVAK